jgi:carbon-monoxide dehydrogenase medium subunit
VLPGEFEYVRPADIGETLQALSKYGSEGKLLAGGQSLIPLLKLRFALPEVVIDINRVDGLEYARVDNGTLRIGGRSRQVMLATSDVVSEHAPLVARTAPLIADPIVRNWGTLAGSLAHADPAGDMGAVMLALHADLVALSVRGERVIPAREFFSGPFTTALEPDEILTEIRIPRAQGRPFGRYHKLDRKVGDFSTVGVAVSLDMDGNTCRRAGIGLTAVGPNNLFAPAAEAALDGQTLDDDVIREAARLAAEASEPRSDIRGSVDFKRDIVRVFVQRALREAVQGVA